MENISCPSEIDAWLVYRLRRCGNMGSLTAGAEYTALVASPQHLLLFYTHFASLVMLLPGPLNAGIQV